MPLIALSQQSDTLNRNDEIRTIFGSHQSNGGYGAFSIGYTLVNNRDAVMFGGRGAWILNHSFAIGAGGEGFVTSYLNDADLNAEANFSGGYGGLFIEPILFPKVPIHISFPIMAGAGGIAYARRMDNNQISNTNYNMIIESDAFFVVEPGAEIELNMTRYFRLAMSCSYRATTKLNMVTANNNALNGISTKVVFKFGWF